MLWAFSSGVVRQLRTATSAAFANARAQTDVMFAALFLLAAMSVLLRAVVDLLTSGLTPWVPETA